MRKAVIYARFSSDKQDEASIDAQVRACREYAAGKGLTVIDTYSDEAVSGKGSKTASRKAYQRMLRDVDKGLFEVILIHKYDRVARNLGEHVSLEKRLKDRKVELIAVAQDFGSTAEAKIMRTLMWSLSEYYLDNLSSEVKKGHRETALKALHNGGTAPFGYDVVNQRYVVNELEAGYVRKLFDAAANREGYTAILAEMEAAGITGKRGKPIKYTQVYEMLRNEKYTGTYIYTPQEEERREDRRSKPNAIRIENALPQIISKAQFMEVQRIMTERKQAGKKAGYLCSGLVYCQWGPRCTGYGPPGRATSITATTAPRSAVPMWCIWRRLTRRRWSTFTSCFPRRTRTGLPPPSASIRPGRRAVWRSSTGPCKSVSGRSRGSMMPS